MNLYDIVIVDRGDFRHFGQVLSRRTPTGTFMVRTVPGHPGTLLELPEVQLTPTDARVKWIHYAEVQGPLKNPRSFNFPVDMLRYDYAAPVNFNLETGEIVPNFGFGEKLIVAKGTTTRHPNWTVDRWRSFVWSCKHVTTTPLVEKTDG